MSTSVTGGETSRVPPAKKRRKDQPKKRKFAGNRYTGPLRKQVTSAPQKAETASSQKLTALASTSSQVVADEVEGYRFWKMPLLVEFFQKICCQTCDSSQGYHVSETRNGLVTVLKFTCVACEDCMKLNSSDEDVNVRHAASIFSIGCHYQKGKQLLCNMNIPPPLTRRAFDVHRHKVAVATATVANESMLRAAREFHESEGKSEVANQNTNESLHNMIWSRCPKTVFVSRERVELAVNDAVITFNEGGLGKLAIFPLLGLRYTEAGLREIDATRVQSSFRGSTPSAKAQMQKKRLSESSEKARESDYKKAKYTGMS